MAFSIATVKAMAAKTAPKVTKNGPSVQFGGTVEGNELVIRVPLAYAESQMRLGKPNAKTGIQSPYVNGMVRLHSAPPVTVTAANGETAQVYLRPIINLNFLMTYEPRTVADSSDDEE